MRPLVSATIDSAALRHNLGVVRRRAPLSRVMAVIKAATMKVAESAERVSVVIKIDHRPGVDDGLHTKVAAVEAHLTD